MGVDCGRCEGFRVHAERYYRPLLDRHGFRLVDCADGHDGRECMVMYRSDRCQLLLSLFDGSDDCILGGLEQPFPGLGLRRTDGQDGWYHVVPLIEWLAGRKLLTARLLSDFRDGRRIYFEWESRIVEQWADQLFALFAPGPSRRWHDDFAKFRRTANLPLGPRICARLHGWWERAWR
jgi:hypothetical protein